MSRDAAIGDFQALAPYRGGNLMRVAAAEAAGPAGPPPRSDLADKLIVLWGMGLLSAPLLQQIAEAAVADFRAAAAEPHPLLMALEKIGHYGAYEGNTRRDLLRKFRISPLLPQWTIIRLPYLERDGGGYLPSFMDFPCSCRTCSSTYCGSSFRRCSAGLLATASRHSGIL